MKTSRAFILVAISLIVGFFAARWCAAQSAHQSDSKEPATDNSIGINQLESFVMYLQDTKQTNALKRFFDYSNVTIATRSTAVLGVTLRILQDMRDGHTNEALGLLEGRVSTDITGFVASYGELPASLRKKISLKVIGYAREYRAKFPFKHHYPSIDEGVVEALRRLDEMTAK